MLISLILTPLSLSSGFGSEVSPWSESSSEIRSFPGNKSLCKLSLEDEYDDYFWGNSPESNKQSFTVVWKGSLSQAVDCTMHSCELLSLANEKLIILGTTTKMKHSLLGIFGWFASFWKLCLNWEALFTYSTLNLLWMRYSSVNPLERCRHNKSCLGSACRGPQSLKTVFHT